MEFSEATPTETSSSLQPQPRKSPSESRVIRRHKAVRLQKTEQIVAQTCSIMQR
jgi:hypothetical protein